jgi:hypothetical protein
MRILAFIEGEEVIKKILKHLGLWEVQPRPPPQTAQIRTLFTEPHIDYSARPAATRLPIAACAYPLFQT